MSQVGGSAVERVFGPVGLDVGADGPEQIAISIVAELLAVARLILTGVLSGQAELLDDLRASAG